MEGEAIVAFRVTLYLPALTTKPEILTPLKVENSHHIKGKCAMPVAAYGAVPACSAHFQSTLHDLLRFMAV